MLKLIPILLTILCVTQRSIPKMCKERSFGRIPVWVEHKDKANFQVVQGCINGSKLKYNPNNLRSIKVSRQNLTTLEKGAVEDITANFTLKIHNTNLTTIKEDAFLNLPQVLEIDLKKNMIDCLSSPASCHPKGA